MVGCQSQAKQTVSAAETKESTSSQPETVTKMTTANSAKESTPATESSCIEEISSNEIRESTTSITASSEIESVTKESSISAEKNPTETAQVQAPLPAVKVEENYQFSVVKNQTTEEFIQSIGKDAQIIAWDEGIYASVMIAQAILETGSGNSQLARPPHHNLFGIKGSYQGKNVSFNTQEDTGDGQLYTIQSAFRQYPSYKESLEDYAALLKKGISGNTGFYQATWKEHAGSYQVATKALTGKYATDISYDKKLNALIETYHLTTYDLEPGSEETTASSEDPETPSESTEASMEQKENQGAESSSAEKTKILTSETKQSVITLPPITQRPAKEVAGNRRAQ
ncbi:hypothetical protein RV10_GL005088 [Enterococcus pallens]|nr:hypothetical protein RV10_GL005088 [Enterococcus pallens]